MSWKWWLASIAAFIVFIGISNYLAKKKYEEKGSEPPDEIYPMH